MVRAKSLSVKLRSRFVCCLTLLYRKNSVTIPGLWYFRWDSPHEAYFRRGPQLGRGRYQLFIGVAYPLMNFVISTEWSIHHYPESYKNKTFFYFSTLFCLKKHCFHAINECTVCGTFQYYVYTYSVLSGTVGTKQCGYASMRRWLIARSVLFLLPWASIAGHSYFLRCSGRSVNYGWGFDLVSRPARIWDSIVSWNQLILQCDISCLPQRKRSAPFLGAYR